MKSNHGGVQGKLPAGLTEVGVEQGVNTHKKHSEEEIEDDNEQENDEDIHSEEEDEGVNEHYYESNIVTTVINNFIFS
jgi:hypothetical protein